MPLFNAERYLVETLDNLLAQEFQDWELVVSDNASTDRTGEIVRELAARDPRVRYYRNSENLGIYYNFDRVLELASGEYFMWASWDNLYHETYLAKLVDALDRRPEAVMAYPWTQVIGEDAKPRLIADWDPGTPLFSDLHLCGTSYHRLKGLLFYSEFRLKACLMYGLIRTEVARAVEGVKRYPNVDWGTDCLLVQRLANAGEFVEIPEPLFLFRIHGEAYGKQQPSELRFGFLDIWHVSYLRAYREELRRAPVGSLDRLRLMADWRVKCAVFYVGQAWMRRSNVMYRAKRRVAAWVDSLYHRIPAPVQRLYRSLRGRPATAGEATHD